MQKKIVRTFSCDFETTVYKGQTHTEVWAAACVELYTEDVKVFHSIDELYVYFLSLNCNIVAYFHNLKFDGQFWMDYLLVQLHYKQAYIQNSEAELDISWMKDKDMPANTFKYSISDMGQWYTITVKTDSSHTLEIKDSLKLLPFSVERIGKSFGTKHKKLSMEYTGLRYAGCEITDEEMEYIANDVLVVKEALEIMYNEGHNKLTIGSCCLSEFKSLMYTKDDYKLFFPDVYKIDLNPDEHKYDNVGEWIRRSYKGGWCYLVKGKECKQYTNGTTADVNSLYPSMMSSESGNRYPLGVPTFWKGNYIPDEAIGDNKYFFVRVKTRFYIKPNMLPFIQIKSSLLYKGTEALESSDIYNKDTGTYVAFYKDKAGNICDTRVELTLTMTDYYLFLEHYDVKQFEIIDGCWFWSEIGIFDTYIEKYKKIKMESTGAQRELAKLFLNNLYGKMASNTNSSFKFAFIKEDGTIGYYPVVAHEKQAGYIPVGSAITSYARNFTIRAAQKNFHGADQRGFIYADTDSIHCDLKPEEIVGIKVDDKNFCCWKLESCWDIGYFTRQKTYIEHVTHENLKPIDKPYYNIKCAGMSKKPKKLFELSMMGYVPQPEDNFTEEDLEFLKTKRTIEDFKIGLKVPGKLIPKRIHGGVVLEETTYEMR